MNRQGRNGLFRGSKATVDPIKSIESIESIKKLLSNEKRNLFLFVLGINNGLRTGDLLKLKVSDLSQTKPNELIHIKESKTGKTNYITLNKSAYKIFQSYLDYESLHADDFLFKSRKGNTPLTIQAVNRLIKKWCKTINLPGNYGAHTLRKTFGYIQRTKFGVGFEVLCKRFNHSSPAVTMRYLGISDTEVANILKNEI
ncbi:integrase family protein [Solidesulfovibrio fructosivorans JJ]]|uniref:Integrase family protein n=1 Tax=Solidesulfovibrio fructosivorans JJ] TaxID=596151 RepID=E1JT86_SOLFR|nr:tyrosine-type recombinase/integrase [Solidesulfovibrio fructosivorans]EFL52346.1 integrase family protein [Solidesulfovibrio fructosivorans JJ]]